MYEKLKELCQEADLPASLIAGRILKDRVENKGGQIVKNNKDESLVKFQELLKTLFQFEASDLDFGIYRILNYKRDLIEKFINDDLARKVDKAFSKYQEKIGEKIDEKLEQKKQEVIKLLGNSAIDVNGDIVDKYKDAPIAQDYMELKEKVDEPQTIDDINDIKSQVYNDLYNFFSRYYEDGDFVPHYRYSIKSHKYAIPYNGEEVKLYWANYDQYYIKTGELFRDYTFNIPNSEYKCVFRVVRAKEEIGSNKATKERFFVLDDEQPVQVDDTETIIRFQYRELTNNEIKDYAVEGGSNTSKQGKINEKLYTTIISSIGDTKDDIKNALRGSYKDSVPLLLYQLNRFTRKNTSDYFIHKNLKKFLTEQLDYFIKSDVLSIDTLEEEKNIDKHITRAKVVKEIGEDIIDFLSQIEDFQKRLWEKKKFVISTEYVITTDRVPSKFYDEIWNNQEQRKEWEDLGFDIPQTKDELSQKKLPIDTKYFSQSFKEQLLEELTRNASLDDLLDGILIKSENWQALNLLSEKYREKVQTIYIDPPYNTGTDGFIYRDSFQHSTWLSMMENRLNLAKEFIKSDGVILTSIDDREQENLKNLMKIIFGEEKFLAQIIRDIPDGTNLRTIGGIKTSTEYVISFLKDKEPSVNNLLFKDTIYKDIGQDELDEFIETRLTKRGNHLSRILFPKGTGKQKDDLNLVIKEGSYINPYSKERICVKKGDMIIKNGILQEDVVLEAPWSMPNILKDFFSGKEVFDDSGQKYEYVYFKNNGIPYMVKLRRKTLFPSYLEIRNRKDELFINLMGYSESPKEATIKPVELIYLLASFYTYNADIIFDFFAGSGTTAHAVLKLNKEDGGKRKFILIEMADYFDTVIIPRIKKVAYSFDWKNGKPQNADGLGVFFKYQVLEQYEDSLDNIELTENSKLQELFKDEYLLKYFLNFETKESPYLLNIDMLKNPFAYKLKVNLSEIGEPTEAVIDIPETFVYLLGLKVDKIKTRTDNGRKYLFILGEKDSQNCAVVFREYSDQWTNGDFTEDEQFIKRELEHWQPSIVYVNGQRTLSPDLNGTKIDVRSIEDSFKKLMEGNLA